MLQSLFCSFPASQHTQQRTLHEPKHRQTAATAAQASCRRTA
jgi:hypothetical protein